MDDIAPCAHSTGLLDVVGRDRENRATIHGSGGDDPFFASLAAGSFAGRLGHGTIVKHGFRLSASGKDLGHRPSLPQSRFSRAGWRKPDAASAMLPGMAAEPLVAIVGAGNLGAALAVSLQRVGYTIEAVIVRSRGASLRKAQRLAKQVGAQASIDPSDVRANLIWFCVPDAEIARAAHAIAGKIKWKGRVALHSSVRHTEPNQVG